MAAKSGQYAALFVNSGTSTLATGAAFTQVGSTTEFYVTDRTHSWWDPAHVPVFYIGGVAATPSEIDYAAGYVTLPTWTTGTVTADLYWFTPEALGGVYGFEFNPKTDTQDATVMSTTLNSPIVWKRYIQTLRDWDGKASRHFFYGAAWTLVDCTLAHSDLVWTLKEWGRSGNLRSVEYLVAGSNTPLEVAYNAGTKKFTVTVATGSGGAATSTAAQVKAHVEADPVLAALVDVDYPAGETGTGIVNAKTAQLMTGGRDQGTDFNNIGSKILIRAYLNITTGSLEMLSCVGILTGVPMDVKLEAVQEADLNFKGIGRIKYHTV